MTQFGKELVGKNVIVKMADGTPYKWGRVIAYSNAPTYVIQEPGSSSNTRFSWKAVLCIATKQDCPICEGEGGYWIYSSDGFGENKHVCPLCAGMMEGLR